MRDRPPPLTTPSVTQHSIPTPHGELVARKFTTKEGTGNTLILLHGGPGSPSDYLEPLSALAAERPVILYDQIGCGESGKPTSDFSWSVASYAEHLDLVRKHFAIDTFHLYGQSWGGYLALAYAEHNSERLLSLVLASPLVDTAQWARDASQLIEQLPEPHRQILQLGPGAEGYAAAQDEYYRRHFCSIVPWPEPLERAMSKLDQQSYEKMWGPNEFTVGTGAVLEGASARHIAQDLQVPNLWITGSDDEARPDTLQSFISGNPLGSLCVIPNATHSAHFEEPELYLSLMRKFLAQHDSN